MPGMAAKVIISERQQEVLQSMVWSRSCPQGLAHRAEGGHRRVRLGDLMTWLGRS